MSLKTVRDSSALSSFLGARSRPRNAAHYFYSLGRLARGDAELPVPAQKHLLIDGANFLQGLPFWREKFRQNRPQARTEFAQMARRWHDFEGVRLTVVFDGRGAELRIERENPHDLFVVIHTPDAMTGDDVIERMVANSPDASGCTVVTADRGLADTVVALGASVISPEDFSAWLDRSREAQSGQIEQLNRQNDQQWKQRKN